MLKIGLTGGIGSGKSTVAKIFAELKVPIIDADIIVHALTTKGKPAYRKICSHFGAEVITDEGKLARKKLRDLVFANQKERVWLENLLHPLVFQAIKKHLKTMRAPYCILVIPLLFETDAIKLVDRALVIDCPKTVQIERITQRDHITKTKVKAIINTQISRRERLKMADDVICNQQSLSNLKKQVKIFHQQYLILAKNKLSCG